MTEPHEQAPDLGRMLRDLLRLRRSHGQGLVHLAHSFSLHVLTGVLAVAAHYCTMYGILAVRPDPLVASTIGFAAGAVTRFVLSFFRVFAPKGGLRRAGARFLVAISLQAVANAGIARAPHDGRPRRVAGADHDDRVADFRHLRRVSAVGVSLSREIPTPNCRQSAASVKITATPSRPP